MLAEIKAKCKQIEMNFTMRPAASYSEFFCSQPGSETVAW